MSTPDYMQGEVQVDLTGEHEVEDLQLDDIENYPEDDALFAVHRNAVQQVNFYSYESDEEVKRKDAEDVGASVIKLADNIGEIQKSVGISSPALENAWKEYMNWLDEFRQTGEDATIHHAIVTLDEIYQKIKSADVGEKPHRSLTDLSDIPVEVLLRNRDLLDMMAQSFRSPHNTVPAHFLGDAGFRVH